jgi:Glycosyl hydrolases family 39
LSASQACGNKRENLAVRHPNSQRVRSYTPVRRRSQFAVAVMSALVLAGTLVAGDLTRLVPRAQPIPSSFFGMHIHRPSPAQWPSVPFSTWRWWDSHAAWPDMESRRGQWDFSYIDRYLSLADEHHVEVLYPLGLTPRWASARPDEPSAYHQPGWAAGPLDIEDWRTYVRTVVTHCRGRVHLYEIWNEPNYKPFWTGTVDEMLVLTREASKIIREIDPHATIVSPAATTASGTKWLAEFLSKGGGQYVDVIGYHFYVNTQPPENMVPIIQQVNQILAENHAAGKPLWDTETGWLAPSRFENEDLTAGYLARSYILAWSAGVQRFYWYAWDSGPPLQMIDKDDQSLKPAGKAYGTIQTWLVGARMDECQEDSDSTWTCKLNRDATSQWIVWNQNGPRKFALPSQWHALRVTPLLGRASPLAGTTLDIGQVPMLIDASSR